MGVRMKLSTLKENLTGRRVVMVDDSIVRGTTTGQIVRLIREAGATKVYVCATHGVFAKDSLERFRDSGTGIPRGTAADGVHVHEGGALLLQGGVHRVGGAQLLESRGRQVGAHGLHELFGVLRG